MNARLAEPGVPRLASCAADYRAIGCGKHRNLLMSEAWGQMKPSIPPRGHLASVVLFTALNFADLFEEATMTADRDLQTRVLAALDREFVVAPESVGVVVGKSIVTLWGIVATLQERWAAERAVVRVNGVRGVANNLVVTCAHSGARTSTLIAEEASRALSWTRSVPLGAVTPAVWDGWVTLTGTVDREHQRYAAERAVRPIAGVLGVFNVITVRQPAMPAPNVTLERELLAPAS